MSLSSPWKIASERAELTSIFGGEERIAILAKPDKVEAYRLEKRTSAAFAEKFNDYRIKSGPTAVSTSDITKLQTVLTNRNIYFWENAPKACIPSPGVRFDFIKGNERLHILLCFECNLLESWQNDLCVGGRDFDPGRAKLLSIVKSIFPNDPDIQALRP